LAEPLKKVLIITYYWPPSGGAGVQRWVKFSQYLKTFGYEPIVVTVQPEKASYALRDSSLEAEVKDVLVVRTGTFEPFHLYKKLLGKKEIPFAGFANETKTGWPEKVSRFVRGNFFIPDARVGWNRFVLPVARRLIREYQIKNLVTTSPPHSTQLIGLKLSSEFDVNWIADLRDPWTDIYYYPMLYPVSWAAAYDKKLEAGVLHRANRVVVVSESIKKLFGAKLSGYEMEKIRVIPNGYDEKDFFSQGSKKKNDEFTITYTGTIADNYHLEGFFQALQQLNQEDIAIRFIGQVSKKYRTFIHRSSLMRNTQFISYISHSQAVIRMISSDLLLLSIPDVPDNSGILTGKLFEYLASGTTIMGVGPVQGDAARIIRQCQAGEMFDYDNIESMVRFLNEKLSQWKNRTNGEKKSGRCRQYSREVLTGRMAELFV